MQKKSKFDILSRPLHPLFVNLNKGQSLPPGRHTFILIGKFKVPYVPDFATDLYETTQIVFGVIDGVVGMRSSEAYCFVQWQNWKRLVLLKDPLFLWIVSGVKGAPFKTNFVHLLKVYI